MISARYHISSASMKAACLTEIGAPLSLADVPVPRIGPFDALIETRTCGICRTDIHIQDGMAYVPSLPHVPGHEPAGVVCEVGSEAVGIQVGDRVVPHLFITCGSCRFCRSGRDSQCSHVKGIIGVTTWGGFAEHFKAPARNLLVLPEKVPFDVGGLTSCAIITAIHAFRRAKFAMGDVALVLGAGGIGQALIQILKHAGGRVAVISRTGETLDIARRLGADLCLMPGPEAATSILEFADGEGAACTFECVGLAATMKLAAECTRRGGRLVVVGEEAEYPAIDTIQIAQRELEILGSRNGSLQDAADALQGMAQGVIRPPIYQRVPLEHINEGMQLVRTGAAHGRVVVDISSP